MNRKTTLLAIVGLLAFGAPSAFAGLGGTEMSFGHPPANTKALECELALAKDWESVKQAVLKHLEEFISGKTPNYFSIGYGSDVLDLAFSKRVLALQTTDFGQSDLDALLKGAESEYETRVEVGPGDEPVCRSCSFLEFLPARWSNPATKGREIVGDANKFASYFPPDHLTVVVMKNFGWYQDTPDEILPVISQVESRLKKGGKLLILDGGKEPMFRNFEAHRQVALRVGFRVETIKGLVHEGTEAVAGLVLTKK